MINLETSHLGGNFGYSSVVYTYFSSIELSVLYIERLARLHL